jgi:ABC-type polysaccharide/polyol phosphate export permease
MLRLLQGAEEGDVTIERPQTPKSSRAEPRPLQAGALGDIAGALSRRWLWGALGWMDVRRRYSGAVMSSLWITANTVLLVLCLTAVLAEPLGSTPRQYAPYVAVGLVIWNFVQLSASEAAGVFVASGETIRQVAMPLSVHVLRLVWRNVIVLAHNAAIVPVVLVVCGTGVTVSAFLAIPAFLLLVVQITAASLLLGLLGARFRDVAQIVGSALQLLFFATPIFWFPQALGPDRQWIVSANPLFAFIDIVRAPLIGSAAAEQSWTVALATTTMTVAIALWAFVRCRDRVAYWV